MGSEMCIRDRVNTDPAGTGAAGFSGGATDAGPVAGFDPVLISLIRRSMPNLVAYDLAGVQPMNGPTGLIFAMRTRYDNQQGTEAFFNEPDTAFSAQNSAASLAQGDYTGAVDGGTDVGFGTTAQGTDPSSDATNPSILNGGDQNAYPTGQGFKTQDLEALGDDTALMTSVRWHSVSRKSRLLLSLVL